MSQAIADRDTVALTVCLDTLTALVAENNELLKGKVVVDPTNPLKLDANGTLQLGRPQRSQLPLPSYDVSSATSSCSWLTLLESIRHTVGGVGWRSPAVHAVLGNASRSSVAPSSTPTYWRADLRLGRCKGKGVPTRMSTMAAVAGRPIYTPAAYEPGVPKAFRKCSKRRTRARVRPLCG